MQAGWRTTAAGADGAVGAGRGVRHPDAARVDADHHRLGAVVPGDGLDAAAPVARPAGGQPALRRVNGVAANGHLVGSGPVAKQAA